MVNTIERLVTLVDGQLIERYHLSDFVSVLEVEKVEEKEPLRNNARLEEAKKYGDEREKELILKGLKNAGGNKSKAAELLGIHRTTLYQKLKKYDLR